MRISCVHVTDFKRIREVTIRPESDAALILIGGKNGQGKSSLLDALTAAFGGKRQAPDDPVRHGADRAEIIVELDAGITIRRRFSPDGDGTLEVRQADGPMRSPQATLDQIVSSRFLDPLAFLARPPLEQRAQLVKLIDHDNQLDKLGAKHAQIYEHRTEIGRDLRKAEGELARLPETTPGVAIDVAALSAERAELAELQRTGDGLGLAHREASAVLARDTELHDQAAKRIAALESQLAVARDDQVKLTARLEGRRRATEEAATKLESARLEWQERTPRRAELDADLARADAHNREVFAAEASVTRRQAAAEAVDKLKAQYEAQTDMLDKIERRRLGILAAADLPVEGLGVDATGMTLHGVPFSQASGAERLRVALALAIAASPDIADIWIRDGALLDEGSLALVAEHAEATGHRCWVERVGTSDDGAIIIQDGMVAS